MREVREFYFEIQILLLAPKDKTTTNATSTDGTGFMPSTKTPTDTAVSTQGPTDAASTQGPTDATSTQGATDAVSTQGPTDAVTTKGITDAVSTQGATDAVTTGTPSQYTVTGKILTCFCIFKTV